MKFMNKRSAILASLLVLGGMLCAGGFLHKTSLGDIKRAQSVRSEIVREGEYTSREDVSAYVRKFKGALPKNFITKAQARRLGWQGGPLEPYAPGKSIGGDRFGNFEHRLPKGEYRECDIDTRGRPRGAKRLVFTSRGERIYYTADHYNTFEEIKELSNK